LLVHEARTRFEGRAPEFGNAEDRQAVVLLALYHQVVHRAMVRYKTAERLEKKLADFEQADAFTLESYLSPHAESGRKRRRGH